MRTVPGGPGPVAPDAWSEAKGRDCMRKTQRNIPTYVILSFFSIVVLLPVGYMITTSLRSSAELLTQERASYFPLAWTLQNYLSVWQDYPMLRYLLNSLLLTGASTLAAIVLSTLAGYGFSRFSFRMKGSLMLFILATQMFPSVMLYVPYYKLLSVYGLSNSHLGIILVYTGTVTPLCTWMMYGYFRAIPIELDEAATIDGAGRFLTFFRIVMPLTLPGLISTTLYAFIQGWNEYMFAMLITNSEMRKTLSVALGQMAGAYSVDWTELMAASTVASLPLIMLFLFLQRYFISSMSNGAVKG